MSAPALSDVLQGTASGGCRATLARSLHVRRQARVIALRCGQLGGDEAHR